MTPNTIFASSAPNRIKSSPTKFGVPGMASVAKPTTRNSAASTGARSAMPPISASDSEPSVRRASTPMIRNSAPATMPWFTIWNTAPCAPRSSKAKIPSVMKPSWAIDE